VCFSLRLPCRMESILRSHIFQQQGVRFSKLLRIALAYEDRIWTHAGSSVSPSPRVLELRSSAAAAFFVDPPSSADRIRIKILVEEDEAAASHACMQAFIHETCSEFAHDVLVLYRRNMGESCRRWRPSPGILGTHSTWKKKKNDNNNSSTFFSIATQICTCCMVGNYIRCWDSQEFSSTLCCS
jgi:hypothetical protein